MLSALILVLAATIQSQPSVPKDLRQLGLDDLISRLPAVGCAGVYDAERAKYVRDPVTEELHRRLGAGERLSDAQWARALLVSEVFRFRSKWPADLPFAICMHDPSWVFPTRVRAIPTDPSLKPVEAGELVSSGCGTYSIWRAREAEYQELGLLTPGVHRIPFDVTVERGETDEEIWSRAPRYPRSEPLEANPPPGILWQGRVTIEVEVVSSVDAVIPPGHSYDLDEGVRRSLLVLEPDGPDSKDHKGNLLISFESWGNAVPELAIAAVSMDVELWRDGELLSRRGSLVSRLGGFRPCGSGDEIYYSASLLFERVLDPDAAAATRYAGLELRVQGVSRDVLHHWGAQTWWDGSFSIPVSALPIEH